MPHQKKVQKLWFFSTHHASPWNTYVSSRVVLLKEVQDNNLIFYTNYKSAKMKRFINYFSFLSIRGLTFYFKRSVALNFYWPYGPVPRQIRFEGTVKKTSIQKSNQYWESRSKESQISQYISKQSCVLKSLEELEKKWQESKVLFAGKKIPRPPHWGGLAFTPIKIEFWQEQPHRLHQRLLFKKKAFSKKWATQLLYP